MTQKYGLTAASWDDIKAEMRHILIHRARARSPIYYSELAAQLQTAYLHYRAPAFGSILREIAAEEEDAGNPMLAVLVVNKQTGRCGSGFFTHAAALGFDVTDPEAFWQAEFRRVCDFWSLSSDPSETD
jgi:hypothetical protein